MAPKAPSVYSIEELSTMDRADLLQFKNNIEEALSVSEENAMNSLKEQLTNAGIDPHQFAMFIGAGSPASAPVSGRKPKGNDADADIKAKIKREYAGHVIHNPEDSGKDYEVGKRGQMPHWIIEAYKEGKINAKPIPAAGEVQP